MSHRRLSRTLFGRRLHLGHAAAVLRICAHAWDEYQAGRVGRVIAALPNLIKSAQALEESSRAPRCGDLGPNSSSGRHDPGQDRRGGFGVDRRRAGDGRRRTSADPLALASAARAGAHALLSVGRFEDALNLGETANDWLRTQISADDPAALSIAGMLSLRTSIAAARRQDRSLATQLLTTPTGQHNGSAATPTTGTPVSAHQRSAAPSRHRTRLRRPPIRR